jgi:hypothetical protein
MCFQKGINRVWVNNYLDTQEGGQFVDQVVVNRVYRGDGEQLSHVEAVGIRLGQPKGASHCPQDGFGVFGTSNG